MLKKGQDVLFSESAMKKYLILRQGVVKGYTSNPHIYVCTGWSSQTTPTTEAGPLFIHKDELYPNLYPQPVLPIEKKKAVTTPPSRHPSSQKFHDLCDQIKSVHDMKQADYGRTNDPFANVRASEDFGMPSWVGCMVRANDKMKRIQTAAKGSELKNEGVEDSLIDLAVYALIGLVLYREEKK